LRLRRKGSEMAHSHQRTLLARMGFGDPDLKLPEHDVACQYIAQPEVAATIFMRLIAPQIHRVPYCSFDGKVEHVINIQAVQSEVMLTKGASSYKSTVGFIDLTFLCTYRFQVEAEYVSLADRVPGGARNSGQDRLVVEVKITPETVASMLRQIAVYREFLPSALSGTVWWILATKFPITTEDATQLAQANIHHVRLGKKFEEYYDTIRDPRNLSAADSLEI
jgi:hypothetical protein